jgi:two-component system, sensor histidine kinase PdtaS
MSAEVALSLKAPTNGLGRAIHRVSRIGGGRALAPVLGVMALVVVFVMLLLALSMWQSHRDAREAAEARATNAVFMASTYAGWVIEANLQALNRIADAMAEGSSLLDGPQAADLQDAVSTLPGDVHLWVFDAAGDPVVTSESLVPASVGERLYFQQLRDGATWTVGTFTIGRVSGRSQFPVARRIERNGEFAGAVISFVPIDLLSAFWRSMDLGPGSTVGLVRNDGWLVARHPALEEPLNIMEHVLFTEHLRQASEGVYGPTVSPADGVSRMVAYRRVDRLPLVATVGISTDMLAGSFWRRAGEFLIFLAPVAIALMGVSVWAVILVQREELALRARDEALERNQVLFREIHHRVKNNLQTVAALIRMQDGLSQSKHDLTGRISAMAAVHEHIYDQSNFDRIEFSAYVRTLCDRLRAIHGGVATIDCVLEPLTVTADQAMPLGLILNEVVANAFKHAFVDGRGGRITVQLEMADAQNARLTVQDDGVGIPSDRQSGLGSQLVTALTKQIRGHGSLDEHDGTRFVLTFPVSEAPLVSPPVEETRAAA